MRREKKAEIRSSGRNPDEEKENHDLEEKENGQGRRSSRASFSRSPRAGKNLLALIERGQEYKRLGCVGESGVLVEGYAEKQRDRRGR